MRDLAEAASRNVTAAAERQVDKSSVSAVDRQQNPVAEPSDPVAAAVETPAFVIDERISPEALEAAGRLRDACGCKVLYALKPLACPFVLELMRPWVDGFAASSLFEARLARSVLGDAGTRPHHDARLPGGRDARAGRALRLRRLQLAGAVPAAGAASSMRPVTRRACGSIRSFRSVADDRYNPCRRSLQAGRADRAVAPRSSAGSRPCSRRSAGSTSTPTATRPSFEPLLRDGAARRGPAAGLAARICAGSTSAAATSSTRGADSSRWPRRSSCSRSRYGLDVFIEPGAGLVREAGFLVAEVIDLFRSGRQDRSPCSTRPSTMSPRSSSTSSSPTSLGHDDDGDYEYLLAGSSCLAGDVMGEYAFAAPAAARLARRADQCSAPTRWSRPTCSMASISRRSIP